MNDKQVTLLTLGDETEKEVKTTLNIAAVLASRTINYNKNKRKKEQEQKYYESLSYAERLAYDIRKANKGNS